HIATTFAPKPERIKTKQRLLRPGNSERKVNCTGRRWSRDPCTNFLQNLPACLQGCFLLAVGGINLYRSVPRETDLAHRLDHRSEIDASPIESQMVIGLAHIGVEMD